MYAECVLCCGQRELNSLQALRQRKRPLGCFYNRIISRKRRGDMARVSKDLPACSAFFLRDFLENFITRSLKVQYVRIGLAG